MQIEVGDRVTYEDGYIEMVFDNEEIEYQTKVRDREIVKVERIGQNGWEVVEEKKELLTEEEREFLKWILKFETIKIKSIEKVQKKYGDIELILFFGDGIADGYYRNVKDSYFKNLKEGKRYTLKELGLEE